MTHADGTIVYVYIASTTVDDHGHRGAVVGVFFHEPPAREAAKGHGWYGGNGVVDKRKAVAVSGRYFLLDDDIDEPFDVADAFVPKDPVAIRRQEALAKLTDEDKKVLGL